MKKNLAVAFAVGLLIALTLWIVGFADEFHRFNLLIIKGIFEKIGNFFG